MTVARLVHSLRILTIRGGEKRAAYARRHRLYRGIGNNVMIQPHKLPLYSQLILFHNNIQVASRVNFITHDVIGTMLNRTGRLPGKRLQEMIGCIEIMDNVFIGAGTTILYNVRIGKNVIVAAESVVTRDLEENGVYAGVPARKIGSFDDAILKLAQRGELYPDALRPRRQSVGDGLAKHMWDAFHAERDAR